MSIDHSKMDGIPKSQPSYEALLSFVDAFPALLWRIDLVNNRIEYLNSHRIEPLGTNCGLLLQNKEFRRKHVAEEDVYLLDDFMEAVRSEETAATIFRLKGEGEPRWIKVTGVLDPKNPRSFIGYMLDASSTAGIVQSITENDAEMEAMIELADSPVLLVDPRNRTVMAHNAAARETFLYKPDAFSRLRFNDLYHHSVAHHIDYIHEELIFEKQWEGRLLFRRRDRSAFAANVRMRLFYFKGRQVIRVAIHDVSVEDEALKNILGSGRPPSAPAALFQKHVDQLMAMVAKVRDIHRLLNILLENQISRDPFDAIIYSDIYALKNKVAVYTAGSAFQPLPQGEIFAYEGTIAENIDRFKLEHLFVDDTFASIKAIDWALFIPHGIRSYFAKPFYERNRLRSVLILCSLNRAHFAPQRIEEYAVYNAPFLRGLKNWRKALRQRKQGRRH